VVPDSASAEQSSEVFGYEKVALDLVLEVCAPVETDRAGDVRLAVEGRVLVNLDDPDRVVVQVLLEPLGLDEDIVRVIGHGLLPLPNRAANTPPPRGRAPARAWRPGRDHRRMAQPPPPRSQRIGRGRGSCRGRCARGREAPA